MKKYELLKTDRKHGLYRIKALKYFSNVKAGDLGGYIASEENLSQIGNCWVSGNAQVSDDAFVSGNARVSDNARVSGNAYVSGNARVSGNAYVSGNALVSGNAYVSGNALVSGNAQVYDDAYVSGNAQVYDDAQVSDDAYVSGKARVYDTAKATKPVINLINVGKHNITITDAHIAIGCENHTIEHWKKNIKKIGLKNKYSEAEIKRTIWLLKGCGI